MRRSLATLDHASADELARYQNRRLRMLVRLAATRSPFYRSWFRESGVDPRAIRTTADLPMLPLLGRRHLADHPRDFLVYPHRMTWAARSSGTSGSPITAYRTPGSSVYELAALERQWGWFGLPRGSRRAVLRGGDFVADRPDTVTLEVPGANQLLVSSFHLTPENLSSIVLALREFRPHAIEGWPSSIALLAGLLRDAGQRFPVSAIITSSEVMSSAQRALMREAFAGPIVDHYGQTERVAMAGTCEAGGYHVFGDYGIVEMLPVPGREDRWEIVGTPLHNWGFPLLRYRTGDEVGPAPDGPCACGRSFPLLGRVDGRVEDTFTASDGRPIPLPSTIVDDLPGLREAQVVQYSPGNFVIRMVPGAEFDRARTEEHARRNVERLVGPGQRVSFETMDRIPRSASGKFKSAALADSLVG
jgi:phenylacetate-CoA ligase